MKKHHSYWVLFLTLLLSGAVQAKVNHYVGAYAQLGEWTLRPVQSEYKPSLGFEGGAGFMYELQAGKAHRPARFLFDVGVGAWGGLTSYAQSSDMTVELNNQLDLQGDVFDYVYEVQNRHDQYRNIAVQVPILLGFHYHRFYMLAGAKVNAAMFTKAYTTANIVTFGRYNQFDEFRNMPDYQFFNDASLNGSARTSMNLDVDLSLEIGGRLGVVTEASGYDVPKRKIEYRIAGFLDYGLLDVHTSGTKVGFTPPSIYDTNPSSPSYVYQTTSMIDNLQVNDIMSTAKTDAEGNSVPFAKSVNNIMVGIKFTILFQLPEQGKCVICQDAYGTSIRPRNGGLKYEE